MTGPTVHRPPRVHACEPPRNPDVAVVGAGIIGASIAHHLALHGLRVAIVDQAGGPGRGATGHSGGMVRAYDPDPAVGELAVASLAAYRDPTRWAAGRAPLHTVGAITVADPAAGPELRQAAHSMNERLGTAAEVVVDRDEVLGVRLNGGVALVEPEAGWVRPVDVTRDWIRQAAANGACTHYGVRVHGVETRDGRPVVHTSAGDIHAGAVVVAGGPWTAEPPGGVRPSSPVRSRSIQVSVVRRPATGAAHATFVDLRTGVYGKPVDEAHSLVGMPHLVWDVPFGAAPDLAHADATAAAAVPYLPWAANAERVRVIRACDGYTDGTALAAETEVPHVWSVRPWNGGGVKAAPEAGRRVAEACMARAFATGA